MLHLHDRDSGIFKFDILVIEMVNISEHALKYLRKAKERGNNTSVRNGCASFEDRNHHRAPLGRDWGKMLQGLQDKTATQTPARGTTGVKDQVRPVLPEPLLEYCAFSL